MPTITISASLNKLHDKEPKLWGDSRYLEADGRTVNAEGAKHPNYKIFSRQPSNRLIKVKLGSKSQLKTSNFKAGVYLMKYDRSKGYFVFAENNTDEAGVTKTPAHLVGKRVLVYEGDSIQGFHGSSASSAAAKPETKARLESQDSFSPAGPSQEDINTINKNLGAGTFSFIKELSQKTGVPVKLIVEQMRQESTLGSNMVNRRYPDIRGPLQVRDSTAAEVFQREGVGNYDPNNRRHQIEAGVRYMARLTKRYKGDLSLALAAYNAGMGNVNRYDGIPPFSETQRYVAEIIERYKGQSTIAYTK